MPCNACLVFLYERCLSHILTHYNVCEWMELSWIHIFSITTWKWWWVVEKTYSMFKWCSIEISLMVNKHVRGLVEGHMPSWPYPMPCMALTWTNVWVIHYLLLLCCVALQLCFNQKASSNTELPCNRPTIMFVNATTMIRYTDITSTMLWISWMFLWTVKWSLTDHKVTV